MIKKGHGESKPPKSGEQLRQRAKLLGHCYIFVQLKYPNKPVLRDSGRICLTTRGEVVSTPSLELVLSYEYQVRKLVVKFMNDGVEMSDALTTAMTDSTTKWGYFLTPNRER